MALSARATISLLGRTTGNLRNPPVLLGRIKDDEEEDCVVVVFLVCCSSKDDEEEDTSGACSVDGFVAADKAEKDLRTDKDDVMEEDPRFLEGSKTAL